MFSSRKTFSIFSGFTLIELLVVISIVSLLSSIVLSSLNTARAKARDARRIADIKEIQKALEMVFNNTGGYPNNGRASSGGGPANCWSWDVSNQTRSFTPAGFLGEAMPNPPHDPTGTDCNGYWYHYFPAGYFGSPANPASCAGRNNQGMYVLGINATMESVVGHMPGSPGPDQCITDTGWGLTGWNYVVQGYEH